MTDQYIKSSLIEASNQTPQDRTNLETERTKRLNRFKSFVIYISLVVAIEQMISIKRDLVIFADAHVVLTRDDQGGSLVLTGEDGKGEGGDQLVIAGNQMGNGGGGGGGGGGQNSNMIMQDAANREGDIVMNGKSMIIPGEDGHIVLADSRSQDQGPQRPPPNPFALWAPYMNNRYLYRMMPFFGR